MPQDTKAVPPSPSGIRRRYPIVPFVFSLRTKLPYMP